MIDTACIDRCERTVFIFKKADRGVCRPGYILHSVGTLACGGGQHFEIPMAVLANGSTASAAELFSAAIKDYKLGKIIGTTTYGKGTAQFTIPLEDGSAVVLSAAKYNPPFSENYNGIGVAPDIEVDLPEELKTINRLKISDSDDTQLQAAISYLNGFEYEAEN